MVSLFKWVSYKYILLKGHSQNIKSSARMTEVSQSAVPNNVMVNRRNRPMPPQNLIQIIQVEKYRLNFLRNCRKLKRPPQSLRCSGAYALTNEKKLKLFAKLETNILEIAINEKQCQINQLQEELNELSITLPNLSRMQTKSWYNHFDTKIKFYKSQEEKKWIDWPKKNESQYSKNRNKRRKVIKRQKTLRKKAMSIIENKQVRVLIEEEIPDEAIVVLGKGLGFVPTPKANQEELRLDARRVTNEISERMRINEHEKSTSNTKNENDNTNTNGDINTPKELHKLSKLKHINYSKNSYVIKDVATKQAVETINCKMNALKPIKTSKDVPTNLSNLEQKGLKWLQEKTSKMEIVVTQADKGGSILIVPPSLMENKIKEKIMDKIMARFI